MNNLLIFTTKIAFVVAALYVIYIGTMFANYPSRHTEDNQHKYSHPLTPDNVLMLEHTTSLPTETLPVDNICVWAKSDLHHQLCMDKSVRYKEKRLQALLSRALEVSGQDDDILAKQSEWESKRDSCYSVACLSRVFGERLRELSVTANGRHLCGLDGAPIIAYRKGFAPEIREREPDGYYSQIGPETTVVNYFSEILGGRGTTIFHSWYKDGLRVARKKFVINGDRWRVWSEKRIDDHNSDWEVHIEDSSGCIIKHETVPLATRTVVREDTLRGGWYKPNSLFNSIIAAKDNNRLNIIDTITPLTNMKKEYIESRNRWGDTPLLLAVRVNNIDAVNMLLGMGASPYVWDASEKSALQLATELNHVEIATMLDERISQVVPPWGVIYSFIDYTKNIPRRNPVEVITKNHIRLSCISKTYGLKGAKLRHEWGVNDMRGNWATHYVSTMTIESNVADIVSDYIPKPSAGTQHWEVKVFVNDMPKSYARFRTSGDSLKGDSVFGVGYRPKASQAIEQLAAAWAPIDMFAYVYEQDDQSTYDINYNLIWDAVASGNISLIKYLYGKGVSLDYPVVHHAIEHKRRALMQYLLSMGMDIEKHDRSYSSTPLHIAAHKNDSLATQMLLDWGANTESINQAKMTPLQSAILNCAAKSAKVLLDNEARISLPLKGMNSVNEVIEQYCSRKNQAEWRSLLSHYQLK